MDHYPAGSVVCVPFTVGTLQVALSGGEGRCVRVPYPGLWHVPIPGTLRFGSGTVASGVLFEYRGGRVEGTRARDMAIASPRFTADEIGLGVARLLRDIETDAPHWDDSAGAAASRDALVAVLLSRCEPESGR